MGCKLLVHQNCDTKTLKLKRKKFKLFEDGPKYSCNTSLYTFNIASVKSVVVKDEL